jgi:periplasmic divalent cation tolerance protein
MSVQIDMLFSTCIVLVTCPCVKSAEVLSHEMVKCGYAACVTVIGQHDTLFSVYWWQGQVQQENEVLLLIKTQTTLLTSLYTVLKQHHPYELPEFIVLPVLGGSEDYLNWIKQCVKQAEQGADKLKN